MCGDLPIRVPKGKKDVEGRWTQLLQVTHFAESSACACQDRSVGCVPLAKESGVLVQHLMIPVNAAHITHCAVGAVRFASITAVSIFWSGGAYPHSFTLKYRPLCVARPVYVSFGSLPAVPERAGGLPLLWVGSQPPILPATAPIRPEFPRHGSQPAPARLSVAPFQWIASLGFMLPLGRHNDLSGEGTRRCG